MTLQALRQWSLQRYSEVLPVMVQRILEGRVIDGHGDAHLGNIALIDGAVRLFDCIEFNASFRIMDSISEIAFLTMDMDARGYHEASHRLLTDYLEYSGDYAGLPYCDIYRCYFAMVRAKVNLLRESTQTKQTSPRPLAIRSFYVIWSWRGAVHSQGSCSSPSHTAYPEAENPPLPARW